MGKALKTAGVIIGAAALIATGVGALAMPGLAGATTLMGVSTGTLNTISSGLVAVGGMLDKPKSQGSAQPDEWTSNPDQPIPFLFGRMGVAGKIVQRDEFGPDNMYQGIVGIISGAGPIKGIQSFKGDDQAVAFGANGIAVTSQWQGEMWMVRRAGNQPDTVLSVPAGLKSGGTAFQWSSSARLSGKACYLQILGENSKGTAYPAGIPDPVHVGEGVYGYDPRYDSSYPGGDGPCRLGVRSTYRYIDDPIIAGLNWALGMVENGQVVGGIGASPDGIDLPAFVECANISQANGWKVAAWPDTSEDASSVLDQFLQAGGAVRARHAGKISCVPRGAPRASVVTVTARDMAGSIELNAAPSLFDQLNTITPRFMSEAAGWKLTPANPVSFAQYVTDDGGKHSDQIDYRFVPLVKQAAELAAYDILDAREPFSGSVPLKPHMRQLKRGDCFVIDNPGVLLDGVKCIVLSRSYDPKTAEVRVSFRSETDGKHALALGKSTTLPDFPVLTPTDPTYVTPPLPEDWVIVPRPPGTGGQVPGFDLSGQVGNDTATAIHVEWWEVPANIDPNDPPPEGADWQSAGTWPPTATTIPIDVQPDRYYWIGLSYVRNQNYSERTLIGPWLAGKLIADDVTAIGGQPVQEVLDRLTSTETLVASVSQAVDELEAVYGDTASAAASAAAAAAAMADAILAKVDAIAAKEGAVSAAGASASSASQAGGFKTDAETAAAASQTERIAAEAARDDADDAALAAASSESNAAASETAAGQKAAAAEADRVLAQTARSQAQTAATNAATSETNAAGSASQASTSQQAAANSRDAAAGSASAAAGSASTASTKAGEAGTHAAAAMAAQVLATTAKDAAILAGGNTDFAQGVAGWATSTTYLPNAAEIAPADWTPQASYQGRSGVLLGAAGARRPLMSRKTWAVDPARKYRIRTRVWIGTGSGVTRTYAGFQGLDAAGAAVTGGVGGLGRRYPALTGPTHAGGTGWIEATSDVITGVGGSHYNFEPGVVQVSLFAWVNYDENPAIVTAIDELVLIDVTESEAANASATAAATSASNASASETAAGQKATAAEGSAVTAATRAGEAQTFRNQAATSASDAAGSAVTASQASGTAVTARDTAIGARNDAQAAAATAVTQASNASASAASAQISANVAAQVGGGASNRNSAFTEWPTVGNIPTSWTTAGSGTYAKVTAASGVGNAWRHTSSGSASMYGYSETAPSAPGGEWVVIQAEIKLVSGNLRGAGLRLTSAAGGSATKTSDYDFALEPDATGVVRGNGVAGSTYRFSKLVDARAAGTNQYTLYALTRFFSPTSSVIIEWQRVAWRPATPEEIAAGSVLPAVQSQLNITAATTADLATRMATARFEVIAAAGGDPAQLVIRADTSGSVARLVASAISFANVVNGTIVEAMRLIGGEVFFMRPIYIDVGNKRLIVGPGGTWVLWFGGTDKTAAQATRTNGYFAFGTDGVVYHGSAALGGTPFTAIPSEDVVGGTRQGTGMAYTRAVTIGIEGASGPVTYAWQQVSGEETWTITGPSSATTTFGAPVHHTVGQLKRASFICRVTHTATGKAVIVTVGATIFREPDGGGA